MRDSDPVLGMRLLSVDGRRGGESTAQGEAPIAARCAASLGGRAGAFGAGTPSAGISGPSSPTSSTSPTRSRSRSPTPSWQELAELIDSVDVTAILSSFGADGIHSLADTWNAAAAWQRMPLLDAVTANPPSEDVEMGEGEQTQGQGQGQGYGQAQGQGQQQELQHVQPRQRQPQQQQQHVDTRRQQYHHQQQQQPQPQPHPVRAPMPAFEITPVRVSSQVPVAAVADVRAYSGSGNNSRSPNHPRARALNPSAASDSGVHPIAMTSTQAELQLPASVYPRNLSSSAAEEQMSLSDMSRQNTIRRFGHGSNPVTPTRRSSLKGSGRGRARSVSPLGSPLQVHFQDRVTVHFLPPADSPSP